MSVRSKELAKISVISALLIIFAGGLALNRQSLAQAETQPEEQVDQEEQDEAEVATSAAASSLKERIEKVVEEKESRNGSVAGQIDYTSRGVVGTIERVSESALTIMTPSGSIIVPLTEGVELLKNDKPIEVGNIEIGNSVIALGLQTGESFTPLKIMIEEKSLLPRPQTVVIGAVQKIARTSIEIMPRLESSSLSFTLNQTTKVIDAEGDDSKVTDLFEDVQVVVAGYSEVSDNEDEAEDSTRVAQLIKALVSLD